MKTADDNQQNNKTAGETTAFSVYSPAEPVVFAHAISNLHLLHTPFYSNHYHYRFSALILRPPSA